MGRPRASRLSNDAERFLDVATDALNALVDGGHKPAQRKRLQERFDAALFSLFMVLRTERRLD